MKSSGRIGPGASTILMILVVLVMTMLGVLSLFSARNDMEMSERTSAAAAEYYAAQTDFSLWLQETDQILNNLRIASGGDAGRLCAARLRSVRRAGGGDAFLPRPRGRNALLLRGHRTSAPDKRRPLRHFRPLAGGKRRCDL